MPGYHVKPKSTPPTSPKSWLTGKLKKRKVARAEAVKSMKTNPEAPAYGRYSEPGEVGVDVFHSEIPSTMAKIGAVAGGVKGAKSKGGVLRQPYQTGAASYLGLLGGALTGGAIHEAMREYQVWKEKRRLKKKKASQVPKGEN